MSHFDGSDQLTSELKSRSHDVGGHPIELENVKRRARTIQRRRRVAGGAVAAVVLGVAVPTALAVTGGLNQTQPPVAPPTPTVTQTPDGGTYVISPGELPPAESGPGIGYTAGNDLYLANGSRISFPVTAGGAAEAGERWVVPGTNARGDFGVLFFEQDADGAPTGDPQFRKGAGPVTNTDGSRLTYYLAESEQEPATLVSVSADESDSATYEVPGRGEIEPVGFLSEDTVVYNVRSPGGELVEARRTSFDGTSSPLPGILNATAVSEATNRVAGITEVDELNDTCSKVMDSDTGQTVWETCDYRVMEFSPDGRFALGTDSYADGFSDSYVVVLDAETGDLHAKYTRTENERVSAGSFAYTFEDNGHVLDVVFERNEWAIARCDFDGDCERVTDVVRADSFDGSPFLFPARP